MSYTSLMKKNKKNHNLIFVLLLILIMLSSILSFQLYFLNRIYPGVYIAGEHYMGLTKEQAQFKLKQQFLKRTSRPVEFSYQDQDFSVSLESIQNSQELYTINEKAFSYGHSVFYMSKIDLKLSNKLTPDIDSQLKFIAQSIREPPIEAQIKIIDEQVQVTPSQDGLVLDEDSLRQTLIDYLNTGILLESNLPTKIAQPKATYEQGLQVKNILDKIKTKPIVLEYNQKSWTLDYKTIASMMDLGKVSIDEQRLEEYLNKIALEIDRPVEEPLFTFDGRRVIEFRPPQEGLRLDRNSSAILISQNLTSNIPIQLVVNVNPAKNKLTNELGIRHLLAQGVSHFAGSIPNRIFNINLAASRINGVLIAPGKVFSFNETVGDISGASGYKQAYVIKEGRTILDDGGGVCQVSTTLFRAALNSGLPTLARTAHAYRVSYYEQGFPPGLDATIFSPQVDFKFKNDTRVHILIQAYTIGNSLYIDLYGTSDGRVSEISKSIVSNVTPPPEDLRQDDPTLPKGTVKQVDWAASGAKVVFSRKVTRDGQEISKETYVSNYRPWQAIYLVGTKE